MSNLNGWANVVLDILDYDGWQDGIEDAERRGVIAEGDRLGMSRIQTLSIYFYTGPMRTGQSIFAAVNGALRSGAPRGSGSFTPDIADFVDLLVSALECLPNWAGIVYRRLQPPQPIATITAGLTQYVEAGFMSTSLDPDIFSGPDLLVIEGTRGKQIETLSAFPGEREVVFVPGSTFRVLNIINDSGSNIVVLEEIVP